MDVIDIARAAIRRWYVMVPVLLVAAGLAYAVAINAESEYEAAGSFLVSDPSLVASSEPAAEDVGVTPRLLSEMVQDSQIRTRVREQGGTADYEVGIETEEGLLRVEARGDTEQETVATVQLVTAELERAVNERQQEAGLPESRRADIEVLSSPSSAQEQSLDGSAQNTDSEAVRYVASGSLRLLVPPDHGVNPYEASLPGTVRVLEEVMRSPQVRQELAARGVDGTYEVALQPRDAAPIINVVATSTSAQGAADTFEAVRDRLREELQERQEVAAAPPSSILTLQPLAVPVGATLVGGELRRPLIVILGLGLVAATSLAVLVEGWAARWRGSRGREDWVPPKDSAVPDGADHDPADSQLVRRV